MQNGTAEASLVGEEIARFHRVAPAGLVVPRPFGDDLVKATDGLKMLAAWIPDCAKTARELAACLSARAPDRVARPVLVHGDLHGKNMLVSPDGLTFIDLERMAVGSPAIDLGYLLGVATALELRRPGWSPDAVAFAHRVIAAYRQTGLEVSEGSIAWYRQLALVEQAVLVTRHLESNWRTLVPELLTVSLGVKVGATS